MNKKAQVFFISAIIIIFAIAGLVATYNIVQQPDVGDDFEDISKNYDTEASKVFNSLMGSDADMFSGLINFNKLFTSYAKSKDPDFGVIYGVDYTIDGNDAGLDSGNVDNVIKKIDGTAVKKGDKVIQVGNYLSEDVIIYDEYTTTYTQVVGCYDKISAVIEFGAFKIESNVNCESIGNVDADFCKCNVLVPYNDQDMLWIRISGYWYPFEIIPNKPQIMVISKEESQDQVQVYVQEIIRSDPSGKESGLMNRCGALGISLEGYYCVEDNGDVIDYCSVACINPNKKCVLNGDLFKRQRCENTEGYEWTVDNKCVYVDCGVVGPVCGDGVCDGDEVCGSDCSSGTCQSGCEQDCKRCNDQPCNSPDQCQSGRCLTGPDPSGEGICKPF